MGKIICPKCKSKEVVPILYGFPSIEAFEMEEQGLVHIGGCCAEPEQPDKYCKNCKHEWDCWIFAPMILRKLGFVVKRYMNVVIQRRI